MNNKTIHYRIQTCQEYCMLKEIVGNLPHFHIYNIISLGSPKRKIRNLTGMLQRLEYKGAVKNLGRAEIKLGGKKRLLTKWKFMS